MIIQHNLVACPCNQSGTLIYCDFTVTEAYKANWDSAAQYGKRVSR